LFYCSVIQIFQFIMYDVCMLDEVWWRLLGRSDSVICL
jgi:hypothetical protein